MKATVEQEVLLTVVLIIITAVVLFGLFQILKDIANELALATAQGVSRDVANLITISGAEPRDIVMQYTPTDKYRYEVSIDQRIVDIKLVGLNNEDCSQLFRFQVDPQVCKSSSSTAVDGLTVTATGNQFRISKARQSIQIATGEVVTRNVYSVQVT